MYAVRTSTSRIGGQTPASATLFTFGTVVNSLTAFGTNRTPRLTDEDCLLERRRWHRSSDYPPASGHGHHL